MHDGGRRTQVGRAWALGLVRDGALCGSAQNRRHRAAGAPRRVCDGLRGRHSAIGRVQHVELSAVKGREGARMREKVEGGWRWGCRGGAGEKGECRCGKGIRCRSWVGKGGWGEG